MTAQTITALRHADKFFIAGEWVAPSSDRKIDVVDSTTEQVCLSVAEAQEADMSRAVAAARDAFDHSGWPRLTHAERAGYLRAFGTELRKRSDMRRSLALYVAGLLAVSLAACSSQSGGSATSASGGSGASASVTTGSAIKLMVIADLETPVQALPQIVTGAQAAANQVNAAGGVNGRKIEILSCNTQGNPNVSASCAREAVSDHVAAVVGLLSITSSSVIPILAAAGTAK